MNLTPEEQDRLLEKAERDYPALTRFKLGEFEYTVYPESRIFFDPSPEYKGNLLCNTGGCIYDASIDQWAEIIPNESHYKVHEGEEGAKITTSTHGGKLFILPEGYDLDMIEYLKSEITRLESELKEENRNNCVLTQALDKVIEILQETKRK